MTHSRPANHNDPPAMTHRDRPPVAVHTTRTTIRYTTQITHTKPCATPLPKVTYSARHRTPTDYSSSGRCYAAEQAPSDNDTRYTFQSEATQSNLAGLELIEHKFKSRVHPQRILDHTKHLSLYLQFIDDKSRDPMEKLPPINHFLEDITNYSHPIPLPNPKRILLLASFIADLRQRGHTASTIDHAVHAIEHDWKKAGRSIDIFQTELMKILRQQTKYDFKSNITAAAKKHISTISVSDEMLLDLITTFCPVHSYRMNYDSTTTEGSRNCVLWATVGSVLLMADKAIRSSNCGQVFYRTNCTTLGTR